MHARHPTPRHATSHQPARQARVMQAVVSLRPSSVVGCRPPLSSSSSSSRSSSSRAGHTRPSSSSVRRQPVAVCSSSASSFHDPSLHNSIDRLLLQQQQQQQQQQRAAPAQSSQETDLLWAGFSALEEQLRQSQRHHESLRAQVDALQAKLHAAQTSPAPPASAWQAASFLLLFLALINFVSLLVNWHVGLVLPFWAGKTTTAGTALWMKTALGVMLPVTNTLVVLIFCLQAVKAAWHCLRW